MGLTPARVEPVAEQGWASWTYEREGLVDEVPGAVDELRRRLDRSEGQ